MSGLSVRISKKLLPIVALLSIIGTPASLAHSYMTSSNPTSGTTVAKLPTHIKLTFNENLLVIKGRKPNTISISTASGTLIRQGSVSVEKNVLSVPIASSQEIHGRIILSYRAVSADGHPVNGSLFFTVK